VVTNYAYWCAVNHYVQKEEAPLGSRDILILDEAHDCMDEICNAVSFRVLNRSVDVYLNRTPMPADRDDINSWVQWAKALQPRAAALADRWKSTSDEDTKAALWHRAAVNSLVSAITSLTSLRGTWVVDPVIDRTRSPIGYSFCPVWPDQYAESVLFIGIPKILLVSATILPKTMKFLGVDDSEYEHLEFPSTFPSSRSPVYSIPTARCSHKMTDEAERTWIDRIDEIVSKRLDRRGVIHTTSYVRRDHILARSRYARFMVVHESGSEAAMAQADKYRRMDPPAILLSPSVTTGYDFAYDACEYVILTKVPFPDTRSPLTAARCGRSFPPGSPERTLGSEWELYTTIQTLVQGAGRGMRAADDQCEIFIIDDQFSWVFGRNKHLFPQWFRRMVETRRIVPVPPRTLQEQSTNNQLAV
jgi:Rad3-related DNA helicase